MGYYGGDPSKVGEARVTDVMDVLAFETYEAEYTSTERELNKDG